MPNQKLPLFDPACCTPLAEEPLTPDQAGVLAPMFKALGDPVRLRLLSLIAARGGAEVCVCDLTPGFDLTGPTISHHLKVLREAGLVDCERRGTWVYYWLVTGALDRLATVLEVPAAGRDTVGRDAVGRDTGVVAAVGAPG